MPRFIGRLQNANVVKKPGVFPIDTSDVGVPRLRSIVRSCTTEYFEIASTPCHCQTGVALLASKRSGTIGGDHASEQIELKNAVLDNNTESGKGAIGAPDERVRRA